LVLKVSPHATIEFLSVSSSPRKKEPPLRLDVLSLTSISHRVVNQAGDSHRVRTDGSGAVKHHWEGGQFFRRRRSKSVMPRWK
jgi:hypothetical protein